MMNSELINKIKNNGFFTHFTSSDYKQQDELGFDILHYAILFGDEKVVSKILKNKYLLPKPLIVDEYMFVYDYSFLASLLNKESLANELKDLSPYTRDSLHCLEIMERIYTAFENTIKTEQYTIRKLRELSKKAQSIKKNQLKERIRQLNNLIDVQRRLNDNILNDIEEARETLDRCRKIYQIDFEKFKEKLSTAPEIISVLIFYIKNCHDFNTANSTIEFEYKGVRFNISQEIYRKFNNSDNKTKRDNSYKENKKTDSKQNYYNSGNKFSNNKSYTTNEKTDDVKPYGDHWFSDEAWKNIDVLRREYRVLAKNYHPDNHPEKIKIFMSIQAERSIILDQLKYK